MDKYLIVLIIMLGEQWSFLVSEPVCSKFAYEEKMLEKMVRSEWKMERLVDDIDNFKSEWKNMNKDVDTKIEAMSTLLNDLNDRMTTIAKKVEETKMEEIDKKAPTVAFSANNLKDLTPSSGQTLIFDVIDYNEGNGYNAATGVFTAPGSGWYLFMAHLCNISGKEVAYAIVNDGIEILRSVHSNEKYTSCHSVSVATQVRSGGEVNIQSTYSSSQYFQSSKFRQLFSGILLSHV
ncbi:Elastin microfibril interfacer [Mactra antiquata]